MSKIKVANRYMEVGILGQQINLKKILAYYENEKEFQNLSNEMVSIARMLNKYSSKSLKEKRNSKTNSLLLCYEENLIKKSEFERIMKLKKSFQNKTKLKDEFINSRTNGYLKTHKTAVIDFYERYSRKKVNNIKDYKQALSYTYEFISQNINEFISQLRFVLSESTANRRMGKNNKVVNSFVDELKQVK